MISYFTTLTNHNLINKTNVFKVYNYVPLLLCKSALKYKMIFKNIFFLKDGSFLNGQNIF